jgi:hypothetical protein
MELAWYEAAGLFVLFLVQLVDVSADVRVCVTWIYFAWCFVEAMSLIGGRRKAVAFRHFRNIVLPSAKP